jgi:hypothetical protein
VEYRTRRDVVGDMLVERHASSRSRCWIGRNSRVIAIAVKFICFNGSLVVPRIAPESVGWDGKAVLCFRRPHLL